MLQLSEFLSNHFLLTSGLVLVVLAIIVNELLIVRRGGQRVSPADAVRMINDQGAVVVDLRSVADFKRGHILDSINIPMMKLNDKLSTLRKHEGKPVLLLCALGSVATQAGIRLRAAGFEQVYPVAGGINAWQNAGLPLTSK